MDESDKILFEDLKFPKRLYYLILIIVTIAFFDVTLNFIMPFMIDLNKWALSIDYILSMGELLNILKYSTYAISFLIFFGINFGREYLKMTLEFIQKVSDDLIDEKDAEVRR